MIFKSHSEKTFETYIQDTMSASGWTKGSPEAWDKQNALFPGYITEFIRETQPVTWRHMEQLHGQALDAKLIDTLVKERQIKGTMHIIRQGFKFFGKTFKLAYFKPAHGMVQETLDLYHKNKLHVTRQVPCHPYDSSTIDMVLSLNGIPLATIELKNPSTGQSWVNAVAQYREHRDSQAPLFQFKKGAIVHFALDPDQIFMTTQLKDSSTRFLPFNRGSNPGEIDCGKGNPLHPSGHRTAYFWEETLQPDSFLDIVANYIFLETREKFIHDDSGKRKPIKEETMIFPRFHQLDAVRKLIHTVRAEGTGHNYLVQHSAGSGKTNSISWLAHRLSCLHTESDEKVFDSVIVVTDRRILDQQLQDAVYQIEHARGVVKTIKDNSRQLAEALVDGTQIIVTTLQKFPFILRGLLHIAGTKDIDNPDPASIAKSKEWQDKIAARRYAVIVDEAHSSQSGETARELKEILGAGPSQGKEEGETDWEDNLNKIVESRPMQKNLCFFAFTSTPKGKTLQLFGRIGSSGKYEPFHTYSMKQAIEERFILDVLKQYIPYKTYFQLVQKAGNDPEMPQKKALKKLTQFLVLHPQNIEQKTQIIIEHFRQHVKPLLAGRAKAMVVTGSRLQAMGYMLSFAKYIKKNKYTDIRPLVAFSGTVIDPKTNTEYTEPEMNIDVVTGNQISEAQLPGKFDSPDYHVLIVANKYQTGFDQPLLCAMYVDKRLDGIQAVQTLSRLNRTYPGKENTFILDFVNDPEDIRSAFQPYYTKTTLDEPSDPSHLELLFHELDTMNVYHWPEVEAFSEKYFLPPKYRRPKDDDWLKEQTQPAVDRFKALDEDHKTAFYEKITAYTRFYSFISQVLPYTDPEHEMLYAFASKLILRLETGDGRVNPHPEHDVRLGNYQVEGGPSVSVIMQEDVNYGVKSPTAVGTGKAHDEEKLLSEIIRELNERFDGNFPEETGLFLEQIKDKACKDERIVRTAEANEQQDKFELGIKNSIKKIMMQAREENEKFVKQYMDDSNFREFLFQFLAGIIYREIRGKKA